MLSGLYKTLLRDLELSALPKGIFVITSVAEGISETLTGVTDMKKLQMQKTNTILKHQCSRPGLAPKRARRYEAAVLSGHASCTKLYNI